jgi:putative mRNA 3-end processing factor
MSRSSLVVSTESGLYCPVGRFHIDAWRPVERTLVTHAHSDHARFGSNRYLCTNDGRHVTRMRVGHDATIDTLDYGQPLDIDGVRVSFHPAGHVLGSAQVRLEHRGEVAVITGDFKVEPDATCRPFEVVRCHTFITECTFGLPVFRWEAGERVMADVNAWWRRNREEGRNSVMFAYALGKAQRVMAGLDASIGPVLLHGATMRLVEAYRETGVELPPAEHASRENAEKHGGRAMVIAPPSVRTSTWIRKFAPASLAVASGWMRLRRMRKSHNVDKGFVLSDHADWPGLLSTIKETGATSVGVMHGYTGPFERYLGEQGYDGFTVQTRFVGESLEGEGDAVEAGGEE